MVNGELSLSLSEGQERTFAHSIVPGESSTVVTGWLFFCIALGTLFTFTFFAALSTSFYCCDKTRKKDHDQITLYDERYPEQKLSFPTVPSSVYPTTHSILQQEENEVVESLSPAYRELPSTHLNYPGINFDSKDQTFYHNYDSKTQNHLTTLLNSSESTGKHYTTSLSSDQLATRTSDVSHSAVISVPENTGDPLRSHTAPGCSSDHLRTHSAPNLRNDSSLSIRVASSLNQGAYVTSSTSGILSGDDQTPDLVDDQRTLSKITTQSHEPASLGITSGQQIDKHGQDELPKELWDILRFSHDEQYRCYATDERRCRSDVREFQTTSKPEVLKRSHSEMPPGKNNFSTGVDKMVEKVNRDKQVTGTLKDALGTFQEKVFECDSKGDGVRHGDHGASSFSGHTFNGFRSSGVSLSKYYALTFRREASILLDKSCDNSSPRGASVFACPENETGFEKSPSDRESATKQDFENRGASAFGMSPRLRQQQDTPCFEECSGRTKEVRYERKSQISTGTVRSNTTSVIPGTQKCHAICKPITDAEKVSCDYEQTISLPRAVRDNLNDLNQSAAWLRGASNLGDHDCYDERGYETDTLGESVSLSFAYESPSEDDMNPQFISKQNENN